MNLPSVRRVCRRYVVPIIAALLLNECGGGNPDSPSTGSSIPTLSSPTDDAVVAAARVVLTVNNVNPTAAGTTYEFQVADTVAALDGPATGLVATAAGIAEGANGQTSFTVTRDLQSGHRYYWRSRASRGGTDGSWSATYRFRTPAVTNSPPVIQSIKVASRAEAATLIDVTATVQDQETNPATLTYNWTSTGGSFTGTGAAVRWQAPAISRPTAFDLTLTVVERYTVPADGGGEETRENRTASAVTVHVNDSTAEITALGATFIDDFLHSERSPESCLRNFSDSCEGKQQELSDIRANRAMFVNNPAASSFGPASVGFFDSSSSRRQPVPASQAPFAELLAPCRFAATNKTTGVSGVAVGTCQLTAVYENWQWYLCDSHFLTPVGSSSFSLKFRF
jgi:hypothetical protein